ncbi:UPF0489 protein C5orf22 [Elysia marginata]|uniref:UPF0489 protein C5orf22 n=1 Tax=Elysia marginata TaxID=1093978 RepID=A0AAV4GGD2_9GAST|nr:UPF0489 protein C5orf22 [Elysia marginata]
MRMLNRIRVTFRMATCTLIVVTVSICLVLRFHYFAPLTIGGSVGGRDNSIEMEHNRLSRGRSEVRAMSKSRAHERAWGRESREGQKRRSTLPVYVLEEHHEAARYWMWAAQAGVLPRRSGNTLIHVDAHSDLATAIIEPGFPMFKWPKFSDVSRLVNENDRFIQAVALTGLFSRVVWVWPTWDRSGILEEIHSDATAWNITLGSWLRPIAPVKITAHQNVTGTSDQKTIPNVYVKAEDVCICATPLNPPKHWNETERGKYCLRENSSDPDARGHRKPGQAAEVNKDLSGPMISPFVAIAA